MIGRYTGDNVIVGPDVLAGDNEPIRGGNIVNISNVSSVAVGPTLLGLVVVILLFGCLYLAYRFFRR